MSWKREFQLEMRPYRDDERKTEFGRQQWAAERRGWLNILHHMRNDVADLDDMTLEEARDGDKSE